MTSMFKRGDIIESRATGTKHRVTHTRINWDGDILVGIVNLKTGFAYTSRYPEYMFKLVEGQEEELDDLYV